MKVGVFTAMVVAVALVAPAKSETPPLLENIAALAVAARWCKDYTVDLESGLKLALAQGMNPTKPPYSKPFDASKEKLEGYLADLGVQQWCAITYRRYKPGGPVPGFMVKN